MYIITHRGLDPSKENYFMESSLEAFTDQLSRGFGLEFDLQVTKDDKIVVLHDADLTRISSGNDTRKINEITADEILAMEFNGCHITSLDTLLRLIDEKQVYDAISAIHLKYHCQSKKYLNIIISCLEQASVEKFIIFDITVKTAKYLKEKNNKLNLAPSVAHPFDISRYNTATGGTLISIDEALCYSSLFNWVWLDEWDRTDISNGDKKFYIESTFQRFRGEGIKIALVTPELHSTSPKLRGGENHSDALNKKLFPRIKEILKLNPDAICTDHPDHSKFLLVEELK